MSFLTLARFSFMVLPWVLLVYLGYFISQIKIEPMVFSMDPKGKITCISKKILDQKTIKEVEKQSLVRQFMTFYFNWDSHLFADRMGEAGSFVTADRWEKERVSLLEKREFLKKVYEIHRSKLTGLFEVNEEQLRAELEITVKNEKKLKTIKKRIQIDFILEEKNRDEENPYVYTISDFKIEERETNS